MMRSLVFVALGGALGSVARFAIGNAVHALWPLRFPLATLGVNALGSLLIGVLYVLIAERAVLHPEWRSIAMVGFLGGFTTFSTFSLETVTLLEHGFGNQALAYVLASLLLCIGGAWLGIGLARVVWSI
jgi:CrcB protein